MAAVAERITIPWLAAALADPVCREYLPKELLAERGDGQAERDSGTQAITIQSQGGKAKAANDEKRNEFRPIVKEMWKAGRSGASIIKDLQTEKGEGAPSQSAVYRWIEEWKSEETTDVKA